MNTEFINFFQLKNNPIINLLIKQKQNHLLIHLRDGQYKLINKIIEQYIDNIPRITWKNTVKIYYEQLKLVDDIMFVEYPKNKISNKSLMAKYINQYPNQKIKNLLTDSRTGSFFEDQYENLPPSEKENINNWLKQNFIKDKSYHDFYNYFVPIKIQKELETSNLIGLCTFKLDVSSSF
jgi:hypothetical protein